MNDHEPAPVPPELLELVDAEITVTGADTPAGEQKLNTLLQSQPGIQEFSLNQGHLAIRYDPVATTRAQISSVLEHAGFTISDLNSTPASPIVGSFHQPQ